jgi:hypothetical protein
MRIFALGLLAFNKNVPSSTEHSWSPQDLQEVLKRWNRFSGPGMSDQNILKFLPLKIKITILLIINLLLCFQPKQCAVKSDRKPTWM